MGVSFENVSSQEGLKKLDQYLSTRSYISGYQASRDDLAVYGALANVPAEYTNASRWFKHITALAGPQLSAPGVGVQIESGAAPATAAAVASPVEEVSAPTAEGDDDDLDLFGDETEEAAANAAREEAAKKAKGAKPKVVGKSSIVMDVKPWDDETDMVKLEECVRAVQMEGLHWGASKLVTVVAGIKKLSIMMTIVDDLVSIDNLIEDYLTSEPNNEYIQSCDIVAFNKI
ncbi:LOW QUALITY PROTEIN: elongation factor 1-delta 1-like [Physcomitrium patens]|uniref:LOW QUALITY PROTEIN: elongation factor 1-delta 1-like n=1 Tax=Physcomitrium patens TaxID=3218 RepID=UPI000D16598C|nr:LOW QUALITY PROTEIN: elongation factor 1-delta 1-like [Physcomitrium patens]|eukprot:XP_024371411.1 LOW QUALITY PROTEIN: elongation factor 1-delta 1-like [Physcomitrella patens]